MPRGSTGKSKTKKRAEPRVSNVVKPVGLSAEDWQLKLRRQAARSEVISVSEIDAVSEPGEYWVRNAQTKGRYRVCYYGLSHPLNACTCMDFRTSRLGTCKHLEAVREWKAGSRDRRPAKPNPLYTTLYMDYHAEPEIRILYGTEDKEKLQALIELLLTGKGHLKRMHYLRLANTIFEAKKESEFFRVREDVEQYLAQLSDDYRRELRLDEVFQEKDWWKSLFVRGVIPYVYQREGIEFAARAGRCIIADEMGLGKTLQAIGTASLLRREGYVSSVLIVCPTSLKYQWQREIKSFVGERALVIEGSQVARMKLYSDATLFKIVSYNAMAHDVRCAGELTADMVIMDEVQRLKNWDTQIARAARKIRSDYRIILSGTPLENKLEELYSVVQLVDQYLLGPYYKFRQEHILTSDNGKVIGYKGLNEVGKQVSSILLRRRKADVSLQLPARMDKNLFVPMTKEQMEIHAECQEQVARIVMKWQRMHFLSETDRRRLLTFLSQMRMVCDSTYILDQKSRYDTKVEETMNLLESILSDEDSKVVVFSGWERMTRLIALELEKQGIGFSNLNGSVPSKQRKVLMDRFQDDPQVRVFLSTDAGATGLNLQSASYVINLDLPWNPAVLEQRIGRIYRIGQRRNIQVINLVAAGTIEERMLDKLKFKTDLFDGVLNGGEDNVFLEDGKLEKMVRDFGFVAEEDTEDVPRFEEGVAAEAAVVEAGEMEVLADGKEAMTTSGIENAGITDEGPTPSVVEMEEVEEPAEREQTADAEMNPEELLSQGVAFFGGLVKTLSNPESVQRLADTLVKEDPATGQTSIQIPVPGKEPVVQLLKMLGQLLEK